mmetsp:Transcript_20668/g.37331  ORF Transcript_20668/g.37331 Transcript_20668/m.37331 type:complete len:241 (-) Transcript_20668:162-884(-)|eukprot:CAMPEP_0201868432 /NCGR_PEP_ID=MMETSP0902-20130614/2319_1 /ASSEMBLY_ACC=CAM_ASM_000551 /TAXON_ID=420261 /ORGANISM="Thalassiosira antarctica, Strain CCMP982" /LENGTH=240 /DNA_ID=CAMNT_0048393775 /DNA_START=76 /DNA_END=798 /DNA_ORIENTATION=-
MNQSSHSQQQENGPLKLSSGQSLEYEELKYFDWGENHTEEPTVFVGGSEVADSSQQQPQQVAVDNQYNDTDQWSPIPFRGQDQNSAIFGFSRQNYMEGIRAWSTSNFGSASPVPDPPSLPTKDESPPGMIRSSSGSLSSGSVGDETMSSDDETEGGPADQPAAKGVSFNEQVRVLPIPPITAYTLEQRYRMYANRFELRENKIRAKKEYEFDGYDWRNATEEPHMAICPLSGELLHPAHL